MAPQIRIPFAYWLYGLNNVAIRRNPEIGHFLPGFMSSRSLLDFTVREFSTACTRNYQVFLENDLDLCEIFLMSSNMSVARK